jgi:hypothetical protein
MKKPPMIGTILGNGFGNTSGEPVLTVWTGIYSIPNSAVSTRMKCAQRCGDTRNDMAGKSIFVHHPHLIGRQYVFSTGHKMIDEITIVHPE